MSSTRRDDKKPKPTNERAQRKKRWEGSHRQPATITALPELMRIKDCARDVSVCTKTIRRWIDVDLLSCVEATSSRPNDAD